MKNKEILEKAIKKASDNGYNYKSDFPRCTECPYPSGKYIVTSGSSGSYIKGTSHTLIFSHNFAKAFWGKEEGQPSDEHYGQERWAYNLQQMVLEPEPLKYLERFL